MTDETEPPPPSNPAPPAPRGGVIARCLGAALLLGLLGLTLRQRGAGGIQIELIALGAMLGPLGFLACVPTPFGRVRSVLALGLAVGSLAGVGERLVAEWSLCLAALAGVVSLQRADAERALPGGPVVAWGSLALSAVVTAAGLALGQFYSVLKAVAVLPVYWEAVAGWRARTPRADLRRALCGWLVVVSNLPELVRGGAWESRFPTSAGLIAALGAGWLALGRGLREAPDSARRRAVRRRLLRVLSPLVVLALLYGLGELAFHVVPNRYRELVVPKRTNTFHNPHAWGEYNGAPYTEPVYDEPLRFQWNQDGWYDRDRELANPAGARRILVIGDSYVEGVQVTLEQHFHLVLERALAEHSEGAPLEAIAYGWSGWGQADELPALTEGVPPGDERFLPGYPAGLDFEPELVVLEVLPANDVLNNHGELEQLALDAHVTPMRHHFGRSLERGLYFSAFLADKLDLMWKGLTGVTDPVDSGVFQESPSRFPTLWAEAWDSTEALLAQIKAAVEARGARLVVVLFTSAMEIEVLQDDRGPRRGNFDFRYPSRRLLATCERLGIPALDLAPLLVDHPAQDPHGKGVHFVGDGHWSPLGHRLAGEATARWLLENDLWPTSRR